MRQYQTISSTVITGIQVVGGIVRGMADQHGNRLPAAANLFAPRAHAMAHAAESFGSAAECPVDGCLCEERPEVGDFFGRLRRIGVKPALPPTSPTMAWSAEQPLARASSARS